jgi:hypothetical protein
MPACIASYRLSSETPPDGLLLDDPRDLAGGRRTVEAENLDRVARLRLLQLLALVVEECAHAAPRVAGDDRVADLERAALHEHRRDRAAADVEPRLDDRAGCLCRGIRAQVELCVGNKQDPFEQVVEAGLLFCRHARDLRRPAPLLRLEAVRRQVGEHAVWIRGRQVDLVDGDDDRHVGGARMRDRLQRLRHDGVVGRDDQDCDVGHLRAAGAHGRECFVARRVEERHTTPVDRYLVRADVLGDAAGLRRDDLRAADRVEQRGLAVVDVTHDRHDRRARLQRVLRVLERCRLLVVVGRVLDRDLALELGRDQLDLLVGERLRGGLHDTERHQRLDDVLHRDAERL